MSRIKFQTSQQGVYCRYLQNNSAVIVRVSPINQTSLPEAQTGLLLDFNIRDSVDEDRTWSAFEHTLRQIFNTVVAIDMIPNCQLKMNVFVLMAAFDIDSAVINATCAALLKMSIPMRYSVYAITKQPDNNNNAMGNKKGNTLVIDLNGDHQVIYGKYRDNVSTQVIKQLEQFRNVLILALNQSIKV